MASFFSNIADRFATLKRRKSSKKDRHTGGFPILTINEIPTEIPASDKVNIENNENSLEMNNGTISRGTTLTRRGTLMRNGGQNELEPRNFWEIRGYKTALKRCDKGHELGSKLIECLVERAKAEEAYSKSLKEWNDKWNNYLNINEFEYGTGKETWSAMLKTGDEVAGIHTDLCEKLQKTPISKLKTWLDDKYQKNGKFKKFSNFKQRDDFENDFRLAQNSWEEYVENIKKLKKEYYSCIRKEREAIDIYNKIRGAFNKNKEQKDKAFEDCESAKKETERAEKSYKDEIIKLESYVPLYEQNMKAVFEKTNDFEETRRKKFEEIYFDCHLLFKEQVENEHYKTIFDRFLEVIKQMNHQADIKGWSKQYGIDMPLIIPQFEEFNGKKT